MNSEKILYQLTGIGYLIIFVTGFFSNFFVLENLIVLGNTADTVKNIIENELLFRFAIAGFVVMVIFDMMLVWTLYLLLKGVNQTISLLAAWLRLVNVGIFAVALDSLFMIVKILFSPEYSEIIDQNNSHLEVMLNLLNFNQTWLVGLIFFGLHLLILGSLIYRSGFIPKFIGILLFMAGIGYLIDGFANIMLKSYSIYKEIFEMIVVIPGVIGEFSFTLWLLYVGFLKRQRDSNEK